MAYGVKYSGSGASADGSTYTAEILKDGYSESGPVTPIELSKPGIVPRWGQQGGETYEPILPSGCDILVFDPAKTLQAEIKDADEELFRLRIKKGSNVYWIGKIITDGFEDSLDLAPESTKIRAIDGLGQLEGIAFDAETRVSFVQAIADLLDEIGLDLHIRFASNWFTPDVLDSDAPLAQIYTERLAERDDQGDLLSSRQVIEDYLSRNGLQLYQDGGIWRVIQRELLAESSYEYYEYDKDAVYVTDDTETPTVTITEEAQYGKRLKGGRRQYKPAYKQTSAVYKPRPSTGSVVVNGSFENWTDGVPDNWTPTDDLGVLTKSPIEVDGDWSVSMIARYNLDPDALPTDYLAQDLGLIAGGTNKLQVRINAQAVKNPSHPAEPSSSSPRKAYFKVFYGGYYLHRAIDGTLTWVLIGDGDPGDDYILIHNAGCSAIYLGWQEDAFLTPVIPVAVGQLRIELYPLTEFEFTPGSESTTAAFNAILYDNVVVTPVDASEGIRTTSTSTALPNTVVKDPVEFRIGDGPTSVTPSRLTIGATTLANNWKRGPYTTEEPTGKSIDVMCSETWLRAQKVPLEVHNATYKKKGSAGIALEPHNVLVIGTKPFAMGYLERDLIAGSSIGEWIEVGTDDSSITTIVEALTEDSSQESVLSRFSSEAETIRADRNAFRSTNWDGGIDSEGHIVVPGTVGWIITGAGEAEFGALNARGTFKTGSGSKRIELRSSDNEMEFFDSDVSVIRIGSDINGSLAGMGISGVLSIDNAAPSFVAAEIWQEGSGLGATAIQGSIYNSIATADNDRNVGVFGSSSTIANGHTGVVNIGVYGTAANGTTNWAGYFDEGNVYVAHQIKIAGGSPGAGKVLVSDADGLASWSAMSGISVTSVNTQTGAISLSVSNSQAAFGFSAANPVVLNIPYADGTNYAGFVSTTTQTFAGNKTFSGAKGDDLVKLLNSTAATAGVQQHSPWLTLESQSWDNWSGPSPPAHNYTTSMYWRIRNEAYATPFGGGCLVFKVSGGSQVTRRPFAIDEQGRTVLGLGTLHDATSEGGDPWVYYDEEGTIYGFGGEDLGQWPLILAGNIAGLNKVVVGWPEKNIATNLCMTAPMDFVAFNDVGTLKNFAAVSHIVVSNVYPTEAGSLVLSTIKSGTLTAQVQLDNNGKFTPAVNDSAVLGSTSLQWSDLFLASGGVVNFANGNAAITHSTGLLTFSTPIAGTSATYTKTTEQLRLVYNDGTGNYYTKRVVDSEGSETATSTKDINIVTTRYFTATAQISYFKGLLLDDAVAAFNNPNATGYFTLFYFDRQLVHKWAFGMDGSDDFLLSDRVSTETKIAMVHGAGGTITLNPSGGKVGIGVVPLATLHVQSATEQLRLDCGSGNITSFAVSNVGVLTIVPSGGAVTISATTTPVLYVEETAHNTKAQMYVDYNGGTPFGWVGTKTAHDFFIGTNNSWNVQIVQSTGVVKFGASLYITSSVPASTTNALYNNGGTLYWNGTVIGGGTGITSLNGLTGATQTFTNDTNITIVSSGTAHVITWSGTLADSRLATISTGGKVSGTAITSGDISTSGSFTTTGLLTVNRTGSSYIDGLTLANLSTGQNYDSPSIALTNDSVHGGTNLPITWRIRNESFDTAGGGGCFVLKVSGGTQVIRRPFAIDEQGRTLLGIGSSGTYRGETSYGFHGQDFGDSAASKGNWPLILAANIAGLNRTVVGWPREDITSDLYVSGKIFVRQFYDNAANSNYLADEHLYPVSDGVGGYYPSPCTISSGYGAPTAYEPNSSLYLRRDGGINTSLYVRQSGAWVGVA